VHYSRLLDIGRHVVDEQVGRQPGARAVRAALRGIIPNPARFGALLALGRLARPLLPGALKRKVPPAAASAGEWPQAVHERRMLLLEGCVQPALSPATNAAAARVLDRLGITLVRAARSGCCGAVSFHLDAQEEARGYMRANIDAWWPHIEQGAEAIVVAASGCGVMVKDYAYQLAGDAAYAAKAQRVSELCRDPAEILTAEKDKLSSLIPHPSSLIPERRVAFHAPCTLQHGLIHQGRKLKEAIEALLTAAGYELTPVPDAHLCCGSAGTYSILQPELSARLRENKIAALATGAPAAILTANIGCQTHLQGATALPVRHWIEAVGDALKG
jgi:glycolate oxidase iron-sulfur subunit